MTKPVIGTVLNTVALTGLLALAALPSAANAQALPYVAPAAQFLGNAAGVGWTGVVGGAEAAANSVAQVATPAGPVSIPVSSKANLAASRIGSLAKGMLKLSPLGLFGVAMEALNNTPEWKCDILMQCTKPDPSGEWVYTYYQNYYCQKVWNGKTFYASSNFSGKMNCLYDGPNWVVGPLASSFSTKPANTKPPIPATDEDKANALADKINSDPATAAKAAKAMNDDMRKDPSLAAAAGGKLFEPTDPITTIAAPVTTPEKQISSRTIANPDGTTSTEKKYSTVTVSPQVSGSTIGTQEITFPQTQTIRTELVAPDGTTKTVSTETVTNPTSDVSNKPATPTGPIKIDEAGTPTSAEEPYQVPKTELEQTKTDAITQMTTATDPTTKDTAWKFSFAFPTGCSPIPMYLDVTVDMCQYQGMVHDLMSMVWIIATVFGVIAMFNRTFVGAA